MKYLTKAEKRILAYIRRVRAPRTEAQIAIRTFLNPATVRKAIETLKSEGVISVTEMY